jgi:hypothetical protein
MKPPIEIPPPPAFESRIRSAVAATKPVALAPRMRAAVAVVAVLVTLVSGAALLRPDLGSVPLVGLIAQSGAVALLGILTLVVAMSAGPYGFGMSVPVLATLAGITAPIYAALTMAIPLGTAAHGPEVRGCFTISMVVGSIGLAGLTFAMRRAVPSGATARGALLGACAGAWAGLAVHLHCPCGDRWHILLGHAAPIAIFATVAAIVTPRLLRP